MSTSTTAASLPACRRHHVAGVLLVAGCIGDDELALAGREVAVGDVDRDALFALGLEAVGQQREVDRRIAGTRLQRVELVGEDRPAVEQQAADQGALAVVDRAGGQEAQGAAIGRCGRLRRGSRRRRCARPGSCSSEVAFLLAPLHRGVGGSVVHARAPRAR
jgi:hypothetical protein